jgi:rhodanese-related sulfurtransferase
MNAPFFKYGMFGDEMSLVVALITGIAFGFFLEQAGFGNSRLLAAQFYFRDLRVLKVMFTAIITAMVGAFLLARFGFLDLSLVYLTPTFLVPQIVGGLILGAGFVIGGYCPGTSCVSAATGRVDGMVYLAGMIGGLIGFAEIYPYIQPFTKITSFGQVTLAQLFHLPYGFLVFAIVLMALGAFVAAEWAEKLIGHQEPGPGALLEPVRKLTPVRGFALVFAGLGVVALFAGSPYRNAFTRVDTKQLALDSTKAADQITVDQLSGWIVEGRNDYLLLDVRPVAAYAAYHIPSAINLPLAALTHDLARRNERIVLYSEGEIQSAQAWFLLRSLGFPSVYMLVGGLDEWNNAVLYPRAPDAVAPARDQIDFAKRAAVSRFFGGAPRGVGPAPTGAVAPATPKLMLPTPAASAPDSASPAKKKKKEGC